MQPILIGIPVSVRFVLYAICIVFALQQLLPYYMVNSMVENLSFRPNIYNNINSVPLLFTTVSYGFLHSGLNHLISNLIFLVPLGSIIANRFSNKVFVITLFGGFIISAFGYYFLNQYSMYYLIGSSGGVSAIVGFVCGASIMGVNFPSPFNNKKNITIFIVLWVILNVIVPLVLQNNIAWESHLVGFIYGFVLALLTRK